MTDTILVSVLGTGTLFENKSIHQIEMERDKNYWRSLDKHERN